ncbi:MAG: hypothetical protein KA746_04930 [Pyrinomonadaceae bacterium]|nr:hypothetical protein [Pyrinomonadaceae bacterium]
MNFQQFFKRHITACCLIVAVAGAVMAQNVKPTPTMVMMGPAKAKTVAGHNNLYCAGYIQQNAIATGNKIVGGLTEAETYNFDENDFLYINMGSNKGVNVGDMFSVVRPRGRVESRWTNKNDIGFLVQEVGAVEVVRVKAEVSVVRVKTSCDSFLLGDLVQLTQKRVSPLAETRPAMDMFADPSGKARGRILMSRDGAEMLTRDYVAYVDLGADDNVQVGDRLTVFRPLGSGNLSPVPQKESVSARDEGFQSDEYRGGKFSNQAGRKSGDNANGRVVTTARAKRGRPDLRQIVGEAVVLNVKEKTATVVITRTAQEIHTGDWVEIQ